MRIENGIFKAVICMIYVVFAFGCSHANVDRTGSINSYDFSFMSSERSRESIKSAEEYYLKAKESNKNGNKRKTMDYYDQFLKSLSEINYELLLDNNTLNNIFSELHNQITESDNEKEKYTIFIDTDNEAVKKYMEIYTDGDAKKRVNKALQKSGAYREMILRKLKENNLPDELVYLPVVESLYENSCRSHAGAVGLWQLMPHRARALGLKVNYWIDERKDPEKATNAALKYLKDLHIMFDDWHLALCAYNRGESGLGRDLSFSKATNMEEMQNRKGSPKETQNFVPQFIVSTLIGNNPEQYGFDPKYEEPVEYDEVVINDVIDLKILAECSDTSEKEIRKLNPELNAWCTPPNYPDYKLKLPLGSKEMFLEKIAGVKDLNPSGGYLKYRVKKGDYLGKIARQFKTSVRAIKKDNKLRRSDLIHINQILTIRPGKKYYSNN